MIHITRFLGDLNADKDKQFATHFTDSHLFKIKNYESEIIYGLKGIGKSALKRALIELNAEFYYAAKSINFSTISFEAFFKNLITLNETIKVEVSNLARSVWMNNLLHYGLEALAETAPYSKIAGQISQILLNEKFTQPNITVSDTPNRRIISQIERIFDYIIEVGLKDVKSNDKLGLNSNQYDVFNNFPLNQQILNILKETRNSVKTSNKKIVICLDGFDTIADHQPESRKAIFAGLTDAIYRLSSDPLVSDIFCFKAFLPKELTADAEYLIWDSDKFAYNEHHLKWNKIEIEKLLEKRLITYSRKKYTKFSDLWLEYMPEKIMNNVHNVEENTFDYILRHTLGRPRQILMHVQNIITKWDAKYSSFKVDPSFIPQVVAETNIELGKRVATQLQIIYPNMQNFLRSWYNLPGLMLVHEFDDRLKAYFPEISIFDLKKLKTDLYNFGLFGISAKNVFMQQAGKKSFKFIFSEGGEESSILINSKEEDYIALSPMLREFCSFNNSEYGVISTI